MEQKRHISPLKALLWLNGMLIAALLVMTAAPGVLAESLSTQPSRVRGDYTMVAGKTTAGSIHAIYVVDAANQEIIALRWDPRQKLIPVSYRSIEVDSRQQPGR